MKDFVIVTCARECGENVESSSLIKHFRNFLNGIIRRQKLDEQLQTSVRKVELYSPVDNGVVDDTAGPRGLNAFLVELPFYPSELAGFSRRKKNKIGKFINDISIPNGVGMCIFPSQIWDICPFQGCTPNPFTGKTLYRSLLLNIIDEICSGKSIKARDLDITIVQGQSRDMLFKTIKLLSPLVRYLTVISEDKEVVENQINEICDETGLSIRVTADFKSGLKNTDLLVSLDNISEPIISSRINPKAVIINYGDLEWLKGANENILINQIDVRLPPRIALQLGENVYEFFNNTVLAEMILYHKISSENKHCNNQDEYDNMERMAREFKRDGYAVVGFVGRRNTFKAKDIKFSRASTGI